MKKLFEKLKEVRERLSSSLTPLQRTTYTYVIACTFWMLIFCAFWVLMLPFWEASVNQTPAASGKDNEPLEKSVSDQASEQPTTFPTSDFLANKMATKYNLGTWDGKFVRSTDGAHCASINERGELWIDCVDTCTHLGTYVPYAYRTYRSIYLDNVLLDVPFSRGDITIYDPEVDKTPRVVLSSVDCSELPIKVAHDRARLVFSEKSEQDGTTYTLVEINKTGQVTIIASANHIIALRATADYPEQGDLAEFWLLRKAYVSGKWDGSAKPVKDIANLMNINLSSTKKSSDNRDYSLDRRNPDLAKLDYVHVNPNGLAAVHDINHTSVIIIDNEPKYYLDATAPWLYDEITYRKVRRASGVGFAEIDTIAEANIFDRQGIPERESPCMRFSVAATADKIAKFPTHNLATTSTLLPHYTYRDRRESLEPPNDFLDNLEILNVENSVDGKRVIVIGYASTPDTDDPEADFTVYLSRASSQFARIADGALRCFVLGDYHPDYLAGNYEAPVYESANLIMYGRTSYAVLPDLFAYDNTLEVHPYDEPSQTEIY
ncbi:hypothetical protein IKG68_02630 [Candidatus Saccharibacteria bacterium]|nr:hypothetical protein [Candidatus Saccharibacteria bacterium]